MTRSNSCGRKIFITLLIACVVFVFSGLGVFAFPKPVEAGWPTLTIKNLGKLIEDILIAIWKTAIYPLIKDMIMAAATDSDWMMTSEQFTQWLLEDVVFQAANVVFKRITGFSLCVSLNWNLRLALTKFVQDDYEPDCTFDNSRIAKLLTQDPKKSMDEIRKQLPKLLDSSVSGSNNDINLSLEAMVDIMDESSRKSKTTENELISGDGLLTTRDCSINAAQAKEYGEALTWIDGDDDGMVDPRMRPDHCRKTTVEGQLAEAIKKNKGAAGDEFGQTLKSQVALDMLALAKMAISSAIETYALDPLKEYLAEYMLDSGGDSGTTIAPDTYSQTGENKLIEFPSAVVTPTGVTPSPDLSKSSK